MKTYTQVSLYMLTWFYLEKKTKCVCIHLYTTTINEKKSTNMKESKKVCGRVWTEEK